jgi:1,4-alpha-glucan branching enzyme
MSTKTDIQHATEQKRNQKIEDEAEYGRNSPFQSKEMLRQSGIKWKPVESREQRKFLHLLRKHRSERSRSFGEGLGDD